MAFSLRMLCLEEAWSQPKSVVPWRVGMSFPSQSLTAS